MAATSNTSNPNLSSTVVTTTTTTTTTKVITTGGGGGGATNIAENNSVSSPNQSRRAAARAVSSPWTQIVRGESEPIASVPVSPSASQSTAAVEQPTEEEIVEIGSGNAAGKKPVWNKPSNGAVEVGPVMGAHSWPALSEGARGSSAKSSSDSLKGLSDGSSSVPVSQGAGTVNSSTQKQVTNNGSVINSTPNHTVPARQKSMKRNGPGPSSNSGNSQPPAQHGPVVEMPPNNPSPRDHAHKSGGGGSHDHPHQQRFPFRNNRNGGSHPRGDGSHHHQNYGGRRDHDRGHQDWNGHRNFNGRDAHMQPQRVMQRFMRHPPPPPPPPPPVSAPYIPPPPVRPFGPPIGYHDLAPQFYYVQAHPDTLRGVPFVAPIPPPHAVFFPAPDPQLQSKIVKQIDYYFSNDNLIKDIYLRQNMDDQGWVPIKLIAGFNKVALLTDNIQLILDSLRSSTIVEVQNDKIRRRHEWMRWLMPAVQLTNVANPQHQRQSSQDKLANQVQNMSLDPRSASHSRTSSGEFSIQSQKSSSSQANNAQGGSDRAGSTRN